MRNMLEDNKLNELLISGEKSFAKQVKYSHKFKLIWIREQQGDLEDFLNVICTCGYAPHRFNSQSEPRTLLVDKFGALVKCCIICYASGRNDDQIWGSNILRELSGPSGYKACILFAIDTDFAIAAGILLRLQDVRVRSAIVSRREARECLQQIEALFKNHGIFRTEAHWTYTQTMLRNLSTVRETPEGGAIGWKFNFAAKQTLLNECKVYACDLYDMTKAFFDLNFPDDGLRAKFEAFDMKSDIHMNTRITFVKDLCKHEGLDHSKVTPAFTLAFPIAKALFDKYKDSTRAWEKVCDGYRKEGNGWRKGAEDIAELLLTVIVQLDSSCENERTNADIRKLQSQSNGGRMKRSQNSGFDFKLRDQLLIAQEVPKEIDNLVERIPRAFSQFEIKEQLYDLRPKQFLKRVILKYGEFYGKTGKHGFTSKAIARGHAKERTRKRNERFAFSQSKPFLGLILLWGFQPTVAVSACHGCCFSFQLQHGGGWVWVVGGGGGG
jgi:hypothetical protein